DPEAIGAVAEGIDDTHDLVAGRQREGRHELAVVDVQVGTADAGLDGPDADLARAGFGDGDVRHDPAPGAVVDDGLHRRFCPRRRHWSMATAMTSTTPTAMSCQ